MTQVTETKKDEQVERSEKLFSSVAPICIKLLQKLNFKQWCLQWRAKCSRGTCPLVYMFHFASGVNFNRNQLTHSVNSAKCRKRSQRMSLSFT